MNKKQAIEWLKAASDDLDNIAYIIKVEHLTNIVAFHSQQAIEKSFKALIEYKKIEFVKTHNLEKIYKKLENIIEVDYEQLEFINELYIDSRYPGDMGLLPPIFITKQSPNPIVKVFSKKKLFRFSLQERFR